ncbi:sulfatase-like hydrolase/transferase [Maribellus comscasis]|uniref:Sulfatase-like hydrolase/transferase n=1 Tax=Maribellus comscasis TaxID=2681766 RepID=A0A6I6K0S8_9BACT|nr:sulfatase-like hydrolase/transferase [Maribellus comscasis]QGY43504.1 sulfatase-like hydrolase/transferase [Maribellus comscasis]
MKRTGTLFFVFILIVFFSFGQKKPNILWITIEDSSPQFFGCYGNKDASTPEIDKLAEEGIRFTNAFSTGTVCSPSRSTIITGVRTFKMGTGNHRSNYTIPEYIHGFPYYLQKQGYYVTNNAKTDYNVGNVKAFTEEAWNESSNRAGWWDRKPGQPFFAVFNYNDSHQSRTMTNTYQWYRENVWEQLPPEDRIGDNEFDMPPFYLDSPEMRKQFARVYNSIKLTDNKIGDLLERLEKDNLRDSTIIFFYADHGEGMPRGKTNGINYGYRVPFVIWFPEMYKELSPWGTQVVSDELIDFEDLAPTLINLAGGEIPDYLEGRILIGKNRSKPVDHLILSADRSDNGIDMVRSITDGRFVYSRNYLPFMPEARYIRYMEIGEIKQQMRNDLKAGLLNPLQKSLFEDRPAEFLFDIENDIWETKNLVNDPRYTSVLEEMRELLDEEVIKGRDVMFLPEYEIEKISEEKNAYEFRLNDEGYPISEIYNAASLSGKRDQKTAKQQVKLLNSSNKIVRYWAITGLCSQDPETLEKYRNKIIKAMDDTYLPVAINAAAIAYKEFDLKEAEEKLKDFCKNDNMNLALSAINHLLYADDKHPFVSTIKQVHEMPERNYNVKAACMDFLGSLGLVPNNPDYRE